MVTTAVTQIIEAIGNRRGEWIKISDIVDQAGLTKEEIAEAITELMEFEDFRAEPEPMNFRVTDREREMCPVIGGEQRHKVIWY